MMFDFLGGNKAVICIDIGFRNIKVAQVSTKSDKNVLIEKFAIIKTPKGCIANGSFFDSSIAVQVIGDTISKSKMRAKASKIIISGTSIITRVLIADKVPGEDFDTTVITKVIPYYLPMVKSDYKVDYKLLDTIYEGNKEQYKIFITAVPNILLKTYVQLLKGLKLKPLAVDIPANSAAKFFNKASSISTVRYWPKEELVNNRYMGTFAVLDFGSEATIVNIFQNRVLDFNRVIMCGSSSIDDHISKELNITTDIAEKLKITYGLSTPENSSDKEHHMVNQTISSFINKLNMRISDCFKFYNEKCSSSPIDKIFIMGGGSQLRGLNGHLETVFKIPVYPVSTLDLDGVKIGKGIDREHLNYLVNSIGISL